MAGELTISYPTGNTLYAVLLDSTGQIYDTVATAFEAINGGTWGDYDITLTESGSTGLYLGTMPSVSAGSFWFDVRLQAGGSPATSDDSKGIGVIEWDGSAVVPTATILADTNELQTDWADGGRLDLILDARASQTTADAIETDTQDIQSRLPAALVSGRMSSDAVAISGSTTAADNVEANITNLDAAISSLNDISTAEVNTEVDTALTDIGLDHLVSAAVVGADITDNSIVARLASKSATADWDSFDNTTDSLEAISDEATPTAAAIADAVWDEPVAGHVGAGSFGATDAAILADTNELQGDWADGGRLDLIVDAILDDTGTSGVQVADKTGYSLSSAGIQAIWDALTSALTTANTIGKLLVDNVNATISSRSSHSATDVRTEMDANSTRLSAIVADTDELQTDWTDGGRLDVIVDAILDDTGTSGVAFAANSITSSIIADNAIDAAALAADVDTYQAKVWLIDDDTGTTDRYFAVWFKNGQPVTSGITSPTIQVVKATDATDLVASTAMTEVGSLGIYKYDEATAANRIVAGAAYFAKIEATIDSSTRTWFQPVGRDS